MLISCKGLTSDVIQHNGNIPTISSYLHIQVLRNSFQGRHELLYGFFNLLVLVPDELNISRKLLNAGITSSGKMKIGCEINRLITFLILQ